MTTLFVSDVHLSAARPEIVELFIDFLAGLGREADALYILGDLFDEWIGDDDSRAPHPVVIEALQRLTASGVAVFVTPGNHDFLLGASFAAVTGCVLLDDCTVTRLNGEQVLLMHGDTLCIRDVSYQTYRRRTRIRLVQRCFLLLPLRARLWFVEKLRKQTRAAVRLKADQITDVDEAEVQRVMLAHGASRLIHGHTHRPATHEFELNGRTARRMVLGDWYTSGNAIVSDEHGFNTRAVKPSNS